MLKHTNLAQNVKQKYYRNNKDLIRERQRYFYKQNPSNQLYRSAKSKSLKKKIPFNIAVEDVIIPSICPVLNIPVIVGTGKLHDGSPSLDRINPTLGYTKGNVRVISHRANMLKNNMTVEEVKLILQDLEKIQGL